MVKSLTGRIFDAVLQTFLTIFFASRTYYWFSLSDLLLDGGL